MFLGHFIAQHFQTPYASVGFFLLSTMSPRKFLTVKEKVQMIEFNKKNKLSVRKLANQFKVSKTQIADILKHEAEIVKSYRENDIGETTSRVFHGVTGGAVIDKAVLEWFQRVRAQKIPISGPIIQAKALEVAQELGDTGFKASNGWLQRFRTRHAIKFKAICGESGSVNEYTVEEWTSKIESIIEGYAPKDVFNADETGLFYRALPDKTLCFKGENCAGGKVAKERLTVLLCASMTGEKIKPLVIGKAAKPRCFKGVNMETVGVSWKFNSKAWMTTDIMREWLEQLDNKMRAQKRKILLFLDNATSHPHLDLKNIKLAFFPPNITSTSQPLDQGVIQNFKVKYRQLILRRLICSLDQYSSAQEVVKSINVLMAVMWVKSAWDAVIASTINNCFKKAGFLNDGLDNSSVERLIGDEITSLGELIELSNMTMDAREFVQNDSNLMTENNSMDIKDILESVQESDHIEEEIEEDLEEEDNLDTTIKNYPDGLETLKKLRDFYQRKHDMEGYNLIHEVMVYHEKEIVNSKKKKQSEITNFFKKV
ncbi:tigger transposable element-derived protein 6 [Cimex lectularius]|uniref:HTH CENPB-type domain-containing protein n=1 Tax=Cimex lectularius TaxID=79782 RepID=A0A8I6S828_CIMLE|nr:tigger transposable element-derived protein 6 [Cimex lectularius]